ncbi:STM4011 family radical SAM protein [Tepidibacter hydrothermalis]|uniref:STM4011 family radical SAM protein n=1 Tax=Tepidibacter hydrothermalis TaxID=3036126 RepID=A0ABY8EFV1_9FIRM|nr:STM4011 family radical SAM protein [Tepidibacter hydrothermalis]WFD11816.1 STM4011 family radical SAM protein [Tepidibacter hydrothermalis]
MKYTIFYRNYMKYCNYKCGYCPFSKYSLDEIKIHRDKRYFQKFIDYIENSNDEFNIFIAPRGELLNFDYYKYGIEKLSKLKNIGEIVVQTNLSSDLNWINNVNKEKLILWTTYHPSEVSLDKFYCKVNKLSKLGIRFTVGAVGIKENLSILADLKEKIDKISGYKPYIWINAYKDETNYYSKEDVEFIKKIDPLFEFNLKNYKCKNSLCKTGENVFWVQGNGTIHRCYKNKVKLGNLYKDKLEDIKKEQVCQSNICTCYIGYTNIKNLNLDDIYKTSILGRIP